MPSRTHPIFMNWPKTQLSGEYVAASLMYGMFGTTWPCKMAAIYVQMNVIWNKRKTASGNKNTFDISTLKIARSLTSNLQTFKLSFNFFESNQNNVTIIAKRKCMNLLSFLCYNNCFFLDNWKKIWTWTKVQKVAFDLQRMMWEMSNDTVEKLLQKIKTKLELTFVKCHPQSLRHVLKQLFYSLDFWMKLALISNEFVNE